MKQFKIVNLFNKFPSRPLRPTLCAFARNTTPLLLMLLSLSLFAQKTPSKEQIEQMKKQVQKMIDEKKIDPEALKKMQAQFGGSQRTAGTAKPVDKTALLASIPKQPLTKQQLVTYLQTLEAKAVKNAPQAAADAKATMANTASSDQAAAEAVMAWYNQAPETGIIIGLRTGIQHPDHLLNLNNLAAMLNLYGSQEKAIPILKTILQDLPNNSMVLNNLGQAYAGLGVKDTAIRYLGRCLALAPHHPQANTTAGEIEESRGNTSQAIEDYRNALKGAYTDQAADRLMKLSPNDNLADYVLPRFDPPYFNMYKEQLLPQNKTIDSSVSMEIQYSAFKDRLYNLEAQYSALSGQESKKGEAILQSQIKAYNAGEGEIRMAPFGHLATLMLTQANFKLHNEAVYVADVKKNKQATLDQLKKAFDQAVKGVDCDTYDALANRYLSDAAPIREEWQKPQLRLARHRFYEMTYWGYLVAPNESIAHGYYYSEVHNYLEDLRQISTTQIIFPCRNTTHTFPFAKSTDSARKAPDCPIDIELPVVIGKIRLTCSQFVISGGEGLRLKYKKDFTTHQSTLSVGAGLGFDIGKNIQGLEISASAKAQESFYVCFDGENHFSDAGLSFEANASASIEAKDDLIPKKIEIATGDVKGAYTLGINSGWNFTTPVTSGSTMFK